MTLPGARTTPIATTTTGELLVGGALLLVGWSFIETTGAAVAELALYDGSSNGGALIADIALSAGESVRDLISGAGLACYTSLFLDVVAGSIRGAVWTHPATVIDGYAFAEGYRPAWAGDE